jgi:hypothetical protein
MERRGRRVHTLDVGVVRLFALAFLLTSDRWSASKAHESEIQRIDLDVLPALEYIELSSSRRQASADNGKLRCLTAMVQRPTIGQCIEVFARPVPLRVCVSNVTQAQERVDQKIVGPRVR